MRRGCGILRVLICFIAALWFLSRMTGPANSQTLVTDISEHSVAITTDFTGKELLVFGAIDRADTHAALGEKPMDVVIVIRGPETQVMIRKKARK